MSGFGSQIVAQIGIVVRDIDAWAERYAQLLGMDKPNVIVTDEYDKARTTYNGQPTQARAKLAFFPLGQVSIELIEPIGGPSTWQEHLDTKGEGVHHIAFWVEDTDGSMTFLAQHNIHAVQQGHFTGGMYTYLESTPQLGTMLELLQRTE